MARTPAKMDYSYTPTVIKPSYVYDKLKEAKELERKYNVYLRSHPHVKIPWWMSKERINHA